jgi:hypothetical protein
VHGMTNEKPLWTYLYGEQLFAKMNTVKNPTEIDSQTNYLDSCLCIATFQISPDINSSVTNKQCQFSH